MKFIGIALGVALSAMATAASADGVRHPIPNSTFPIAQAVTVTGNTRQRSMSAARCRRSSTRIPTRRARRPMATPRPRPSACSIASRASWKGRGSAWATSSGCRSSWCTPRAAPMDFKAFMEGYTQFFGGSQPNLPARSVVGVAALANPGFLVEIEVIAAKDAK